MLGMGLYVRKSGGIANGLQEQVRLPGWVTPQEVMKPSATATAVHAVFPGPARRVCRPWRWAGDCHQRGGFCSQNTAKTGFACAGGPERVAGSLRNLLRMSLVVSPKTSASGRFRHPPSGGL
jgi:hypothetical protein